MAEHTNPQTGRREYPAASVAAAERHTHLEDLLHTIRLAEARWRRDDRIDLATRLRPRDVS